MTATETETEIVTGAEREIATETEAGTKTGRETAGAGVGKGTREMSGIELHAREVDRRVSPSWDALINELCKCSVVCHWGYLPGLLLLEFQQPYPAY